MILRVKERVLLELLRKGDHVLCMQRSVSHETIRHGSMSRAADIGPGRGSQGENDSLGRLRRRHGEFEALEFLVQLYQCESGSYLTKTRRPCWRSWMADVGRRSVVRSGQSGEFD